MSYRCDFCKDTGLYQACCRPHECSCGQYRERPPAPRQELLTFRTTPYGGYYEAEDGSHWWPSKLLEDKARELAQAQREIARLREAERMVLAEGAKVSRERDALEERLKEFKEELLRELKASSKPADHVVQEPKCGKCPACRIEKLGCCCDGVDEDDGCFKCEPDKFPRPPCPEFKP